MKSNRFYKSLDRVCKKVTSTILEETLTVLVPPPTHTHTVTVRKLEKKVT